MHLHIGESGLRKPAAMLAFRIGLSCIVDADKCEIDPQRRRGSEPIVLEHVTCDDERTSRLDRRSDIAQGAARLIWSQNLNEIAQHRHVESSRRHITADIAVHDLDAISKLGLAHHRSRGRRHSRQVDDGGGKIRATLAGGDGQTARAAADIEQAMKPLEFVGSRQLLSGGERTRMQPAKERAELLVRHGCKVMLDLWAAGTDGRTRRECRVPQIAVELVSTSHIARPAAHKVGVGFQRVGETTASNREQPGIDKRVKQQRKLLSLHFEDIRQCLRSHRSAAKRREDVKLHSREHRHRRIEPIDVAKDRGRLDVLLHDAIVDLRTMGGQAVGWVSFLRDPTYRMKEEA